MNVIVLMANTTRFRYVVIKDFNSPVAKASQQLSFRYLHVKQAKTGLLDAFLTAYAPYEAEKIAFFDWVKDIYDPEKLQAEFLSSFWADRLVDKLLKRE